MSSLSPASEVILRHLDHFADRHVLIAVDLQDTLASQIQAKVLEPIQINITSGYLYSNPWVIMHFWFSGRSIIRKILRHFDLFWPKNKNEATFQLRSLCASLSVRTEIFIVGENRSGVKSATELMNGIAKLKIDSARRCSLFWFTNLSNTL